jgi:hypothetical protein
MSDSVTTEFSRPGSASQDQAPERTESRQAIQNPVPTAEVVENDPKLEEVAALAYQLWIERGSPHGSHEEDWFRAEQELRGASGFRAASNA